MLLPDFPILLAAEGPLDDVARVLMGLAIVVLVGLLILIIKCYRKVNQGEALVRNGMGGTKVCFTGVPVIPIIHKAEIMDIGLLETTPPPFS